jgi:branched-chain amino acid aminotransferase
MPPTGKGSLYIRPLLMGSGAVLDLAPAPEYAFIIFVSPIGNYFKVGALLQKILPLLIHKILIIHK